MTVDPLNVDIRVENHTKGEKLIKEWKDSPSQLKTEVKKHKCYTFLYSDPKNVPK